MNADEKRKLDNHLLIKGLKGLNDPEMLVQLGSLIPDGGILAGMLNECEGSKRREMYDAIRPHLRFKPMPFFQYENFFRLRAEAIASRGNPVIVDKYADEQGRINKAVGDAIADMFGGGWLRLTCSKCTREKAYRGRSVEDAEAKARKAGWVADFEYRGGELTHKEICPRCPAVRPD